MNLLIKHAMLTCIIFYAGIKCTAQSGTDYFSPLSSDYYTAKIKEVKQRKVPALFKDKKQQKAYAEIIKDQNESIAEEFENDLIIHDTLLLNRCANVLTRLKTGNPTFPFDSVSLYINRTVSANACAFGEGTLFINLGLFLYIDNDDELAMIIGHELSHQFLHHAAKKIRDNIELLSSDEFLDEVKSIKKSNDGRYLKYKNLMKDIVVKTSTHSRYKESEADSLSAIFLKNAGYDLKKAALIILKLDKVDALFVSDSLYNIRTAFGTAVNDNNFVKKKYNGLSMVKVTMNADKEADSVKTHPDCIVRYKQILNEDGSKRELNCCDALNSSFRPVKERALIELIRYEYEMGRLTLCTHLSFFALQNGFTSPYYYYYLSLAFSGMYYSEKKLERFTATNANANPGTTLKELQDFIFNLSSDKLAALAVHFLNQPPANASDDYEFAKLMYDETTDKNIDITLSDKAFIHSFPKSKYNYLLIPKKTKK